MNETRNELVRLIDEWERVTVTITDSAGRGIEARGFLMSYSVGTGSGPSQRQIEFALEGGIKPLAPVTGG